MNFIWKKEITQWFVAAQPFLINHNFYFIMTRQLDNIKEALENWSI